MKILTTKFNGLKIIEGIKFDDSRGYFREIFLKKLFKKKKFIFWCMSKSKKNVLRGMHTQTKKTQTKKSPSKVVKKAKANTVANNKSKIAPYKPKKNEKYMSAAMKRHFIAVLLLWKEHLLDEMQKTFDHLRAKGETYADPVDRASQEEEFAFELRTRDRERKLINKISTSIEKIKQDDYGWCESCGDEIGVKRLEARPTATHCIDCKTLDEIKERQLSG